MARFKNGILGGFSGKIGDAVGYQLRGECIGRALPKPKTGEPTAKEIANRAKFAFVQQWLKPLTLFLRVGFRNYNPRFEGFVAAKSYNSKNALTGSYPNFAIDPALALVSFGSLSQATTATALLETQMTITVRWSGGIVGNLEKAMILLYDIAEGKVLMDTSATWRSIGVFNWKMDAQQHNSKRFHVYLAFTNSEMSNQSNSQYLGSVFVI